MKKIIGILCVAFALVLCLCSCTNEEPIQDTNSTEEEKPIEYITYEDAFYSKYSDIYHEEVFPVVNSRWKAEQ